MSSIRQDSHVVLQAKQIWACETSGIYVQGEQSCPLIEKNLIKFCRSAAIQLAAEVTAEVVDNSLSTNDMGIELSGNSSKLLRNKIEKCHDNGIK